MPDTSENLALLGTGIMGRPMGERLLAAGHRLTVWNRTPEKAAPLAESGAEVAATVAEAVTNAEGIILMLADGTAIRETVLSDDVRPLLAERAVLQMGTISPVESQDLLDDVEAAGGHYLEAPVLGSVPQARGGSLRIMFGGDEVLWERWRPVLKVLGLPRHVGGVGAAAALKLALNNVIASLVTGYAVSLGLVRRSGIDRELFAELLRDSPFHSKSFDAKLPGILKQRFTPANFPARHLLKDVRLIEAEAERLGLRADHLAGIEALLERTVESGHGDDDYSSVAATVDPLR